MGISAELGEGQADPGLGLNSSVTLSEASVTAFLSALSRHRHHEREVAKV